MKSLIALRNVVSPTLSLTDEGTNDFQIIDMTPNSIIGYDVNVDEEGNTTDIVLLFGMYYILTIVMAI